MLKEFALITISVSNLGQVESAWKEQFEYRTLESGTVSTEQASYWQAPAMEGNDYLIMETRNQAPVYIRFVENELVADYNPMTSHGWNATELLATNVDTIAANMEDSDFDVIGAPKDLWPAPDAPRVMQAIGPGKELLYITVNNQAAGALGIADNMPLTERPFIMVLGGPSMADFNTFYKDTLGLKVGASNPFKITTISKANGLNIETTYPLAMAYSAPGYMIELDELPDAIGPRTVAEGYLPPGVAMVSFNSDGIDADVDWVTEPLALAGFPYNGRKAGILRGPAGELIEVILNETP